MDDDTAMTAAVAQAQPRPSPPRAAGSGRGFFAFLKDGVLVTTRNRGLFLRLAALHAARWLAWLAVRFLAYWYLGRTLGLKANGEDRLPLSTLLDKLWWLLAAGAAYLVVKVAIMVLGLAIQLATYGLRRRGLVLGRLHRRRPWPHDDANVGLLARGGEAQPQRVRACW